MRYFSPLEHLPTLSRSHDIDLRVKRDDLLPFPGGGNKVRKVNRIMDWAMAQGFNAVVTTGGIQSNHARVVALLSTRRGWPCKVVVHGNTSSLQSPRGNLLLMCLAGAEIVIVPPESIAASMEQAMSHFISQGYVPYEIPGGGHCVRGSLAYYEAVQELEQQCIESKWQPDWIVLASGTGATQAGIIVGLEAIGWSTKVVGISVARNVSRGKNIVEQACAQLREHLKLNAGNKHPLDFRDDWVGGGYEKADSEVFAAIRVAARMESLVLDPTYTGKAFNALLDLRRSGEIQKGSRVLFWHTGGLLNLMASDYLRDILQV